MTGSRRAGQHQGQGSEEGSDGGCLGGRDSQRSGEARARKEQFLGVYRREIMGTEIFRVSSEHDSTRFFLLFLAN